MRNRSPANSDASSPPVPARISRITLRSSMASLGMSARRMLLREVGAPRLERGLLGRGQRAHLGYRSPGRRSAPRCRRARTRQPDRPSRPRPGGRARRIRATAGRSSRGRGRPQARPRPPHGGRAGHRASFAGVLASSCAVLSVRAVSHTSASVPDTRQRCGTDRVKLEYAQGRDAKASPGSHGRDYTAANRRIGSPGTGLA